MLQLRWFFDNSMKLNPDKCYLLIFGGKNTDMSIHIGETRVTESVEGKLLGVTLDKNLDFKSHVNAIHFFYKKKVYKKMRLKWPKS